MEIVGSFLDEEWESLSQIFSNSENHDFLLQHCNGSSSSFFSSNGEIPSPTFFPSDQISQESSNTTKIDDALFFNIHGNVDQHHNYDDTNTFDHQSMNFHSMDFNNAGFMLPADVLMDDFLCSKGENQTFATADSDSCQIKRKLSEAAADAEMQDQDNAPQNPKKKPRISRNAQKNKKGKKTVVQEKNNNEEEMMNINGGNNKQSCSSCSSEDDDSNASQELNEEMKNLNAKTRASRGSATDPQSLYARRRRERINERLKILQNLVPNGTKVDISTMLEEAVQYVKFLQLQIKLLSSDNMWMYAPLAYNGMDLSMYQNICPNLRS